MTLTPGDLVRIRPTAPGRRDGGVVKVTNLRDDAFDYTCPKTGGCRTARLDRIRCKVRKPGVRS